MHVGTAECANGSDLLHEVHATTIVCGTCVTWAQQLCQLFPLCMHADAAGSYCVSIFLDALMQKRYTRWHQLLLKAISSVYMHVQAVYSSLP